MSRIRWYGPAVVVVVTVLTVMLLGPGMVRHLAWAEEDAKIQLIRQDQAGNASLADLSNAFRQVAKMVEPSVVSIKVATRHAMNQHGVPDELRRFFGPRGFGPMTPPDQGDDEDDNNEGEAPQRSPHQAQPQDDSRYNVPQPYGSGSGWVYDAEGHIVTNNHVIADADVITVSFQDGSERNATVVATDPKTDVAVIKVEGGDLHPAMVADLAKNPVEQGDIVFAFGSPFHFEFSMSQGIISAKGRELGIVDIERDPRTGKARASGYENFIQTDAAINPGNSGGPLTNVDGQVIGMNTAIASATGSYNGLGFAIPIDMVDGVVRELIKSGHVTRGYLGIEIKELTPEMARNLGVNGKGVFVNNTLEGEPAEKAGLKSEDVIIKVNGKAMTSSDVLRKYVASFKPGDMIAIDYVRDGKPMTTTAVVAEQPKSMIAAGHSGPSHEAEKAEGKGVELLRKLGIESLSEFTPNMAAAMGIPFKPGVFVRRIRPGSEAADKQIIPNSIITRVMGVAVKTPDELLDVLEKHDVSKGVRVTVMHGDESDIEVLEVPK